MLSISSFSNNINSNSNRSLNFKSNIFKTPALREAVDEAILDLSLDCNNKKRGLHFFRALEGLKNDGKNDSIIVAFEKGDNRPLPYIKVNGNITQSGKYYHDGTGYIGSQCQMAVIDFAKSRGIDVDKPALSIESKVELLKEQFFEAESTMIDTVMTKLKEYLK